MSRRLLLAVVLLSSSSALAAGRKVAVMDIKNIQGVGDGTATILTNIVVGEVGSLGSFEVIGSNEISAMIGFERQKQLLGCAEETRCLAEIGGALGVDYLLTGQVGKIGSRFHLSLMLSSTAKSRIVGRAQKFSEPNDDALVVAAQMAVRDVFKGIEVGPKPAVATTPKEEVKPPVEATPPVATALKEEVKPAVATTAAPKVTPKADETVRAPTSEGEAEKKVGRRPSALSYVLLGSGAALVTVGILVGLGIQEKYTALEKATAAAAPVARDAAEKAYGRAPLADGMFIAGAAAVGVGTYLWLRAPRAEPLKVTVSPLLSTDSAGLVAAGSF